MKRATRVLQLAIPRNFSVDAESIPVYHVYDCEHANKQLQLLHKDACTSNDHIVGLDTESRPANGDRVEKLALVQLCSASMIVIVNVSTKEEIPHAIVDIINDFGVKKAGSDVMSDIARLNDRFSLDLNLSLVQPHTLDTQVLARETSVSPNAPGLRNVVRELFCYKLDKSVAVRACDWASPVLDDHKLLYAAMDAFASRAVAVELLRRRSLLPMELLDDTKLTWADEVEIEECASKARCLHTCKLCKTELRTTEAIINHMYDVVHIKNACACLVDLKQK